MKKEEDKRTKRITISLTPKEYETLLKCTKETHETMTEYCRRAAFLEIERQERKKYGQR